MVAYYRYSFWNRYSNWQLAIYNCKEWVYRGAISGLKGLNTDDRRENRVGIYDRKETGRMPDGNNW